MKKQRRDWSKIAKYDVLVVFVVVFILLILIYTLATTFPLWITLGFAIVYGFMGSLIYFLVSRMRRGRRR